MKNRFLWILCALLSLLVLTGGCNRKPASTADVPRSLSHQYKIAVAPSPSPATSASSSWASFPSRRPWPPVTC